MHRDAVADELVSRHQTATVTGYQEVRACGSCLQFCQGFRAIGKNLHAVSRGIEEDRIQFGHVFVVIHGEHHGLTRPLANGLEVMTRAPSCRE